MENPEDVLQALDDFQKLRPSEIPRELEDYLCWVAKTGDPVYQWPLIKALFREKLVRVMTDFYETCPNVDGLSSCPNVEHFNYDTMKSSLLEQLESFANAPFTIQRICELLTTPRKEYNRIDKFMRAIEKNILVVSTREPGPAIRRSENGEGMVNGSVDDDLAQGSQTSDEMEMDTLVKDCGPATLYIPSSLYSSSDNDVSSKNTSVVKQLSSINGSSTESTPKLGQSTTSDVENLGGSGNFVPSNLEFVESSSSSSSSNEKSEMSDEFRVSIGQMSTVVHETSTIVGEVPEAIMNEDTSSQPSLDLESDESESNESPRKLQTTFQAKDFISSYKKDDKAESEEYKVEEDKELVETSASSQEVDTKSQTNEESVTTEVEADNSERSEKTEKEDEKDQTPKEEEEKEESGATSVITDNPERVVEEKKTEVKEESSSSSSSEETASTNDEEKTTKIEEEEEKEVEEKPLEGEVEEKTQETLECAEVLSEIPANEESESQLTIEETTEDNVKTNSLVPEPIPIIEEPKETEEEPKKWENATIIEEENEEGEKEEKHKVEVVAVASENHEDEPPKKVLIIEERKEEEKEQMEEQTKQTDESMDVDGETTSSVEPMETSESVS